MSLMSHLPTSLLVCPTEGQIPFLEGEKLVYSTDIKKDFWGNDRGFHLQHFQNKESNICVAASSKINHPFNHWHPMI